MKRNSTTLFLESPNAITPVPWVTGAPDFSGFNEPTLSVLQRAWDERESEPEIIPDPVPIVEPVPPNWAGWQLAMLLDPGWTPVANGVGHFTSALYTLIGQVQDRPETVGTIAAIWGQICTAAAVSVEQRAIWRSVAESYNLPAQFVDVI